MNSAIYDKIATAAFTAYRSGIGAITIEGTMPEWMEFQGDIRIMTTLDMSDPPRPDKAFKMNGVEITFRLPRPYEEVVVMRKRDGHWLRRNDGKGRLVLFMVGLPPLKLKRQDAEDLIRIDMGRDLEEFEFYTLKQFEGLTTPEALNK